MWYIVSTKHVLDLSSLVLWFTVGRLSSLHMQEYGAFFGFYLEHNVGFLVTHSRVELRARRRIGSQGGPRDMIKFNSTINKVLGRLMSRVLSAVRSVCCSEVEDLSPRQCWLPQHLTACQQ